MRIGNFPPISASYQAINPIHVGESWINRPRFFSKLYQHGGIHEQHSDSGRVTVSTQRCLQIRGEVMQGFLGRLVSLNGI